MNFITKFSLKNPAAIVILTLLVAFAGGYSALGLKKETMPDINIPIVAVIVPYPGASPSDIMDLVTKPMEKAISGVANVDTVNSTSTENVSAIIAQFPFSADMNEAKRQVEEAAQSVKLPEGAIEPQITRISFGSFPILKVAVSNKGLSDEQIEKAVKETLMPSLTTISGVGQVNLASQKEQAIHIKLLPDKLKENNLTLQQVQQQLQGSNVSVPITSVTIGDKNEPIRVSGKLYSIKDIKNLQISIPPNPQDGIKDAFQQIGDGMGQLGGAVGQLGQGMAGMSEAFNAQIQLVNGIQQTQAQVMQGKMALQQANMTAMNPAATPSQKKAAQATIQKLTPQIQVGEAAVVQMQKKLKEIQSQMSQQSQSVNMQADEEKSTKIEEKEQKITLIPLSKIAEITMKTEEASAVSRMNGTPSVALDILKTQESNTVDVAEAVKAELNKIKGKMPKDTQITVMFDQSTAVKQSVNGMLREGLLGALFACIVILLFLRNFRTTLISIVSIPLSILIAMLFLKQYNITLNILTLGGVAVAIGRVVDDSIVVIENIYRNLQQTKDRDSNLILFATKEVASAITSSTITTVAVFLPLGFVEGMIGKVFMPFALTVVFSLLASLLVALTVVPILAKVLMLKQKKIKQKEKAGKGIQFYQRVLGWSLNHKFIVLLLSAVLLGGSFALVPYIGTGFIPESKEKYLNVDITYPIGTTIETTDEKAKEIEQLLLQEKSVEFFQTSIGSAKGSLNENGKITGSNTGKIFVKLKNDANVDDVLSRLRKQITIFATDAATTKVTQFNPNSGGANNSIELVVNGKNMDDIKKGVDVVTKEMEKVKSLDNITNNLSETKPEIDIQVNQKKASEVGLSAGQIIGTVREYLTDQKAGTIKINAEDMDILLGVKLDKVNAIKNIKGLGLTTGLGKKIELSQVAAVKKVQGPVSLFHRNTEEYATVTANITSKDIGGVSKEVALKIQGAKLPNGVTAKVGGSVEQMNDSFKQLGVAILVAIGAVYLVMVLAFGGTLAPLSILFSLPLAIIGGLVGLYLTGKPLDMPAMIGALMLIGIVVTNAIVLIDRVQQERKNGSSIRQSLLESGSVRMRPILMTAIATICALLPLAAGFSEGTLISQSLAIVVIGGLTISTLLTLLVVPVAYELLHFRTHKREKGTIQTKTNTLEA